VSFHQSHRAVPRVVAVQPALGDPDPVADDALLRPEDIRLAARGVGQGKEDRTAEALPDDQEFVGVELDNQSRPAFRPYFTAV
jgi:hypothetical protein